MKKSQHSVTMSQQEWLLIASQAGWITSPLAKVANHKVHSVRIANPRLSEQNTVLLNPEEWLQIGNQTEWIKAAGLLDTFNNWYTNNRGRSQVKKELNQYTNQVVNDVNKARQIIKNVGTDSQAAFASLTKLMQDVKWLATMDPNNQVFQAGQIQNVEQAIAAAQKEVSGIAQYVGKMTAEINPNFLPKSQLSGGTPATQPTPGATPTAPTPAATGAPTVTPTPQSGLTPPAGFEKEIPLIRDLMWKMLTNPKTAKNAAAIYRQYMQENPPKDINDLGRILKTTSWDALEQLNTALKTEAARYAPGTFAANSVRIIRQA